MDTKLSSELNAITMRFNQLFDDFQLLDESIVRYLMEKGGEYLSARTTFDKHFLEAISALKSIDYNIKSITAWEQEDSA